MSADPISPTMPPVAGPASDSGDSAPGSPPRPARRKRNVGTRGLWWFLVPGVIVYVYVVVSPAIQGIGFAFTDWSLAPETNFVGLDNFVTIFSSEAGPAALRTLFIAVVVLVLQNVLGLALALLLNGRVIGRNLLRTIIFAPMVVSALVVGYLFKYIFGPPGVGGINVTLAAMGLEQIDFLGNPTSGLWIIIVVIVWQFTGSTMVIYLAGLQAVPKELEEAAAIDGAGYWKRFWYVIRPILAPAITINLMLSLIGGLKIFDQIFAVTGGGPGGQTKTISTLIYEYFSLFGQYGLAAALALILAIAVGILSFIQFRALRRMERNS